jgi:hypothetical protein
VECFECRNEPSWLDVELAAFQEFPCPMELVYLVKLVVQLGAVATIVVWTSGFCALGDRILTKTQKGRKLTVN